MVAQEAGLVALRRLLPAGEGGVVGRRHPLVEHHLMEHVVLLQPLQVVGPALGSMNAASTGTACAPNSLTNRTMRGQAAANAGRSRSSPWYQPK